MGCSPSKISPVKGHHVVSDPVSQSEEVTEIRIVLIGKTGCGKSATGNSFLQKSAFVSSCSGASTTRSCCRRENTYQANNKKWKVVVADTPGMFNTGMKNEAISEEIVKCLEFCSPGPHVFCFVMSLASKLTEEEQATLLHFVNLFGVDLFRYLIFVLTYADNISENQTIQEVILDAQQWLKDPIKNCDNRCVLIDNKTNDKNIKQKQLTTFLTVVDGMIRKTNHGCYTTEMYNEADRQLKQQIEEMNKNQKAIDDARAAAYIRDGVYAYGKELVTTAIQATGIPTLINNVSSRFTK